MIFVDNKLYKSPGYKVTIVLNRTYSSYYVNIGGVRYSSAATLTVPVGEVIRVACSRRDSAYGTIYVNGDPTFFGGGTWVYYDFNMPKKNIQITFDDDHDAVYVDSFPDSEIYHFTYNTRVANPSQSDHDLRVYLWDNPARPTDFLRLIGSASDQITAFNSYTIFEAEARNNVYVNDISYGKNIRFRFLSDSSDNAIRFTRTGSILSYKYYVYIYGEIKTGV